MKLMKPLAFIPILFLIPAIASCSEKFADNSLLESEEPEPAPPAAVIAADPFAEGTWGVYTWGGNPKNTYYKGIKGVPTVTRWSEIEPLKGVYKFDEVIGERLKTCRAKGYKTFIKIYVAPNRKEGVHNSPDWLFEQEGIPLVEVPVTIDPFRNERHWTFPWYFDQKYLSYQFRMIEEFGKWFRSLPQNLQDVVIYVQSAEGSTGDGQPYKGEPIDPAYRIPMDDWKMHRVKIWEEYKKALTGPGGKMVKPLLVNYDANGQTEYDWLLKNLDVVGLKNGMFSHGYHISDGISRLETINKFREELEKQGKWLFIRGEQDGEWNVCGWSKRNPEQAFYWSAIYATHCGLDMWNFPSDAAVDNRFAAAIDFFNKYAGPHHPAASKYAFCALRKGLNATDTEAYPESVYGTAGLKNKDRYIAIANSFGKYGAYQGDPDKAIGSGMLNRQRDDYNDAGWNILPGNYEKFLTQIDADQTSVGLWHVQPDNGIYSRFARSFENATGKNALYFRLDPSFFGDGESHEVKIDVTYLDKGNGSWSLNYISPQGVKQAYKATNKDKGEWVKKTVKLTDAVFAGKGERGSDIFIRYESGDDTVFHLIEIER